MYSIYSPNRCLDVAYTRLRFHRCGLGFHKAFNLELCKLCTEGDDETIDHIFMYCEAQKEHRRNLEAKMFKLGYITFDTTKLLFPPPFPPTPPPPPPPLKMQLKFEKLFSNS